MLRLGEDSKSVNQEFGDSGERLRSSRIVGVLAPVKPCRTTGVGHAQKGSRTRTKHADSALWIGPKDRVALGNNWSGNS
jgi:hypothetical protein